MATGSLCLCLGQNENNTSGDTHEVSAAAGDSKSTINAAAKTITLPEGVTGRVFVNHEKTPKRHRLSYTILAMPMLYTPALSDTRSTD